MTFRNDGYFYIDEGYTVITQRIDGILWWSAPIVEEVPPSVITINTLLFGTNF